MREAVRRAARALLPVALCVALALLETHLASTQPTSSAPPPPLPFRNPYAPSSPPPHSYFANDSLLGRRVPCTDEEKECLRYNRIYSPVRGHCYALGEGPGRCGIVVDPCEFHNTGHVRGTCAPADVCAPYSRSHVRMAFDGQCVEMNRLKTVCGPGPVNIVLHFFGDAECAPTQLLAPAAPVTVAQPEERGVCAFPNLRHDLTAFAYNEFFRECSEEQSVCFARRTVWLNATRTCHALLERGPCEEGERVVLSRAAWEAGAVEATCAPVNPCANLSATAHRLMAFDGRCYDAPTILRALCPSGVLLPNAFGEMACVRRDYYRHVIQLQSARPRTCTLAHRVSYDLPPDGTIAQPDCGLSGKSSCPDAF